MKHRNIIRRLTMSLPELEQYHREKRKVHFEQGMKPKYIKLRKVLYPLFRVFLKVDRLFRGQTITVIGERRKYPDRVIFACTHIGQNDLENIYETIQHSCWWFVGDPCILYKDISGLLIYLNGSIFLDTSDKDDRRIAYLRSVDVLKAGGSLMIYPEGARNGSLNLPVMPLFPGTAKMAMETNTKIVPVAIEQYDKKFIVKMGTELEPEDFSCIDELTQELRDRLATLKWEIWEQEGQMKRNSLPEDYAEKFVIKFEQYLVPWDTLESVERTRFHTKEETEQKDAFAYVDKLIPRKENAFLFRKNR